MKFASFLSAADHMAAVVVIIAMLFASVLAYRRTKMSAFLCLICGLLIFMIVAAGMQFCRPASTDGAVVLLEWGHVGHLAATILCGIGIVPLIGHVRTQFDRKDNA